MNQRLDWRDWRRSEQGILWPVFGLGLAVLTYLVPRRWSSHRPTVPGDARLKRFASGFVGLIPAYVPD